MPETGIPVSESTGAGSAGVAAAMLVLFSLTSTTSVAPSSTATVTVSSTSAMSAGQMVLVDEGTPAEEWVKVLTIPNGTTFTAAFKYAHGPSSWTIAAKYQVQIVSLGDPATPGLLLNIGQLGSDAGNGGTCINVQGSAAGAPLPVVNGASASAGGIQPVSGSSTDGTAVGARPTACNGLELHIPANTSPASITYLIASSAPGSAPASGTTETITGPSAGNPLVWPIALAPGQNVYVTALSGTVQFRYV